jgi:hypothetical protein
MSGHRTLAWFFTALIASWVSPAAALDREGAIEAARGQMRGKCSPATPCTFTARLDNKRWYVHVEFTTRKSPQDKPAPHPGGHAILVIDQSGKVVGRMEGK